MEAKIEFETSKDYEVICHDTIKILEGNNVSDAIGNDFINWNSLFPIFLFCSTGTGKTYFSERVLVKACSEKKSSVLLLSNRSATDVATKKRLAKFLGKTNALLGYNDYGISTKVNNIDNIYIMTYQKLKSLMYDKDGDFNKIMFKLVIIDEAEFFLSDALFNFETSNILNYIVKTFRYSIRLYMTATPNPIYKKIYTLEETIYKELRNGDIPTDYCYNCNWAKFNSNSFCDRSYKKCKFYYDIKSDMEIKKHSHCSKMKEFQPIIYELIRDYKYLNLYSCKSLEEITKIINDEEQIEKEKDRKNIKRWVIFVNEKKEGKKIHNQLQDSVYIDADTKLKKNKANKAYSYLIEHEKFDQKVLICTSVFDNGINLNDRSIKNIVIDTTDRNQFIQMLGRKRVVEGEKVNLYVIDKTKEELQDIFKKVDQQSRAIDDYNEMNQQFFLNKYYNKKTSKFLFSNINGFFNLKSKSDSENIKIEYNKLAKDQLDYLKESLENVINKMNVKDNEDNPEFIKTVFSWLGREDEYNNKTTLNYHTKEELKAYLIKYLDDISEVGIIERNDFKDFRKTLYKNYLAVYGLKKNENGKEVFSTNKINKKFIAHNLPYHLEYTRQYYMLKKNYIEKL